MAVSLTINGETHNLDVEPAARLSDVLRRTAGFFGTKSGCDAGDCGACT
ncbi:MAG: 2Fe-2S iron-sulfur cluster-binding protein, partial [Hyphomicrobiales bacterium]